MTAPWFKRDPLAFERTVAEVTEAYPDLRLVVSGDLATFVGSIPITSGEVEIDRFTVAITIPPTFPHDVPIIRETANRIPKTADWHNPGDLCVIVPEEWLVDPRCGSVLEFIRGPVRDFFIGHLLAEAGRGRPFGERDHGLPGLLQAYGEWFGTTNRETVCRYLGCLSHERIKGHWPCPCGSQRRIRNCHRESIRAIQVRVSPRVARGALARLKAYPSMRRREYRGWPQKQVTGTRLSPNPDVKS